MFINILYNLRITFRFVNKIIYLTKLKQSGMELNILSKMLIFNGV